MEGATDYRDGGQSSFTQGMLQDIGDAVRNRNGRDHGYSKNCWDIWVLQRYILDTYGKKYSYEWIRQILHKLGYSYKRSTKHSSRANKEAHTSFKNGLLS